MAAQKDLTTGPLGKQVLVFSVPLIASNLLQVLFNMADVAVVGRFAGTIALGAVGSTTILVSLFPGLLIGLSSGVNVLAAISARKRNGNWRRPSMHRRWCAPWRGRCCWRWAWCSPGASWR